MKLLPSLRNIAWSIFFNLNKIIKCIAKIQGQFHLFPWPFCEKYFHFSNSFTIKLGYYGKAKKKTQTLAYKCYKPMVLYLPNSARFHIKMMWNYKFLPVPFFRNSLLEEYFRKEEWKSTCVYSLHKILSLKCCFNSFSRHFFHLFRLLQNKTFQPKA